MAIEVENRPYVLAFQDGPTVPASAEDVRTLIRSSLHEIDRARPNRIEMRNRLGRKYVILPATLGGGPAFKVTL